MGTSAELTAPQDGPQILTPIADESPHALIPVSSGQGDGPKSLTPVDDDGPKSLTAIPTGPVNPYATANGDLNSVLSGRSLFSNLPPVHSYTLTDPASRVSSALPPQQNTADRVLESQGGGLDLRLVPRAAATKAPANFQEQLDQQANVVRAGNQLVPVVPQPMSTGSSRPAFDPVVKDYLTGMPLNDVDPNDPGSVEAHKEAVRRGANEELRQEAEDETGAAMDASGISGAITLGSGLKDVFTPTDAEGRASGGNPNLGGDLPGAPMTPQEKDTANKHMMVGLAKTIAGGGQVAMVLGAPEVGGIFKNALAGDLASKIAMAKIAGSITVGAGAAAGTGVVADKLNVSPEAKNLMQTAAFFIPSLLGGALGIKAGVGTEGEVVAGVKTPGGNFVGVRGAAGDRPTQVGRWTPRQPNAGGLDAGPLEGEYMPPKPSGPTSGDEGESPAAPPSAPPPRPAPPSAPEVQANAQMTEVTRLAATAQGNQVQAEQLTGMRPPPPPKPKMPSPAGMDDGHLSQQTVDTAGQVIQSLPPAARPSAILEAVNSLTKWIAGKGTILGPDDQVVNVDSPKSAQAAATKIINAEMEKQKSQAEDAADEKKTNLETAQQERDEAITPTEKKESTGNAPAVQIPKGPQVDRARAAIQGAPADATADHFDQIIRKTALVTTPVRKALVDEEVNRRANTQEDHAATAMNGQPAAPGQSRTELQAWADGVKNGEHPFVHVPAKSDFVPAGADGLTRTKVNGAGAFSGTYYHAPEVSAADIRKAARDKIDPQGALEAIVAGWKSEKPVELGAEEISTAAVKSNESGTLAAPGQSANTNSERKGGRGQSPEQSAAGGAKASSPLSILPDSALDGDMLSRIDARLDAHDRVKISGNVGASQDEVAAIRASGLLDENDTIDRAGIQKLLVERDRRVEAARLARRGEPAPIVEKPKIIDLSGMGNAMSDNLYQQAFDALKAGKDTISGVKDPMLKRAKKAFDAGLIKGPEDIRKGEKEGYPKPEPPVKLTPEAATGLQQIVEAAKADDPAATLDTILRHPADGKIITQALVNDGIITDSDTDVNPATSLLTTRARTKVGDALLSSLLGPELTDQTPPFVREKLLGSMGSIGSIAETGPEWNLKPALEQAVAQYGKAFRGEETQDSGPVVDAIVKKLDGSPEEMRKAFSNYAVSASAPGENPNPVLDFNVAFGTELTPEQFAEGMKGAVSQPLAEETKPANSEATAPTGLRTYEAEVSKYAGDPYPGVMRVQAETRRHAEALLAEQNPGKRIGGVDRVPDAVAAPTEPAAPRPLAKGDQVTYRTNKGKERTGEVAWTDGKKVRISDGGSTVNKPVDDVNLASVVPAEATGEASLVDHLHLAFSDGRGPKDYNGLKKLVAEFDGTEPNQLRMKEAQEAYEAMLNRVASEIVLKNEGGSRETFSRMVNLYEKQPNLSIRTSTSIDNQAYSTPLPLAFIADRFAGIDFKRSTVYEPTAGNGALLIAADPDKTLANEFNPARAATLKAEGFKVTTNDATTWSPAERVDAVVANPPFAKLAAPIKFDGYNIVKFDHLIAAKALGVMKDQGRAAIIIGAGSREEPGEVTNAARPFFNYLYSHYNVVSDFELDGDLYARQGASFPVRVIAIDGRTRTAKVSPVAEDIQRLKTWEEVYAKASEHLGSNLEGRPQSDDELGSASQLRADTAAVPRPAGRHAEQGNPGGPSEVSGRDQGDGIAVRKPGSILHSGRVPTPPVGSPDITARPDGDVALSDRLAEGQSAPRVVRREPAEPDGRAPDAAVAKANALADEANQFQSTYTPRSEKKDVGVQAPKALIDPMHAAMDVIAKDVGDLDEFVANELGYPSLDEMHSAFMGIQVDAIAAAIYQVKRGKALIVGDQTGRGKGRIAAAMQRWSDLHGHLPIFITEGANGFSAMADDLKNIGSGDTIAPLLLNADASVTNSVTGQKMFQNNGAMRPVIDRIRETGQLPAGRNALWLTYSQINTDNRQQMLLHRLAPNAVFIFDESHNAAGDSNTGGFIREIAPKSKGATFLSATWAKRPDNLPVYAGMTDISIAIPDMDKIVDAIKAGGAPLQAVMTNQLVQSAQFVRRETSYAGIEFKSFVDYDNQAKHEKISDKVTEALRAIMAADSAFHNIDFERILAQAKKSGKSANSAEIKVSHMEFSSVVHNMTKQLLLAMKVDGDADRIITSIENGEKPLYALENTGGAFLSSYVEANNLSEGDPLPDLTYSKIVDRALMRTRYYNEKDEMGNEPTRIEVPLEDLSPAVREKYDAAQALIDKLNVDLPVSPIDHIRDRIEKAGYKTGEITGRDWRIDYSGEVPRLAKVPGIEKKDRVNTATQFNNGSMHLLIFNKAGASMISLHASENFLDQRPRHMTVGQTAGDVNTLIQTLGRTNRTGQVALPLYTLSSVALPAEMRPNIVASKKMKSLNANVSSNTRSATSIKAVDMFNKYGDKIVAQYLLDNPEMEKVLGVPIDVDAKGEPSANEGKAMKATGHSALLTVKEQQQFMDAITEAYTNYIDFLDETGQNDLEPVTYDYDARETHKERMYQGTDPSSPFGQDAHYGEYSIKRQGKPFTPEEVSAKLAETYGPKMMELPPHQRDTLFARGLADHFEELYKPYADSLTTQNAMEKASAMRGFGRSLLNEYRVGSAFSVEINGDVAHAVVTNIEGSKKTSGNPYAPSSLQFTLAINSPLRSIKVPGSQISKITTANLGRNADIAHLFKDVFGGSLQKAKIITGNLLGAYGELKAGVKGRIISFTMNDGTTQLGIQMPTKFDVKTDISDTYAMRSPEAAREFLSGIGRSLQSSGQEIGVFRNPDGGLNLRTKVSKATSGKFFLDPRLRELVIGGDFVSSGGLMKATVKDGMEQDALEVIMGKIALYAPSTEIQAARKLDEKMQTGGKPTGLRKVLGGEEGFANVDALLPKSIQKLAEKAGNYLRKAVPATWGELSKATGVAVKTPKAIGYEIASVLYPAMLADAKARDIMGRALGEPALELFKASQFLSGIDKMFEGMPEDDWFKFLDRWMTGEKQPTDDLQKAQEFVESALSAQRMSEQATANLGRKKNDQITLQDRANYAPLRYSKPPGKEKGLTEEERVARVGEPRRPFQGSKSFMKQKKYETASAARADGGVLLGNPVRMVLRRISEGAKWEAAQHAIWNFRQVGKVVYKSAGAKMPPGMVKMNDNIARVFRPVETAEGSTVFIPGGEWVIEKDAGRLLNNYLSSDPFRNSLVGGGFIKLVTSSMAFKMAGSPFHYGMMTFWGVAEGVHAGIDELYNHALRGTDPAHLLGGAKKLATALINPITKTVQGNQIVKMHKDGGDFIDTPAGQKMLRDYPDLPELLRLVFAGGFRMGTNEDIPDSTPMSIRKDLVAGRGLSVAQKTVPFLARFVSYPLFNFIIPRMKLMANIEKLSMELDRHSAAIADGSITPETVARNVVAVNENSFGEFNYQNNYWNNSVKTAMQLLMFAPGWKEGTWRGAAQAAKEVFTQGYADKFYEKVDAEGKAKGWRKYPAKLPALGQNTGRMMSALIVAALIATAIAEYLHHLYGKTTLSESIQQDVKENGLNWLQAADLEVLHPRSSKVDKYGKPIRFNLPTDLRDFEHAATHPQDYAGNSLASWLIGVINTLRNRDFKDDYVYDPAGHEKLKEMIYYNLGQDAEPIGASNYLKKGGPQDTATKIEQSVGLIGGAPKGWDDTRSVARALELRQAHDPRPPMTPAAQHEKDMLVAAPPTPGQAKHALRTRNLTELDKIVMRLSYTDAKDVYDHATADEKKTLLPIMRKKQAAAVREARRR